GVTMGPVATARQRDDVRRGIAELAAVASLVVGGAGDGSSVAAPVERADGGDPGVGFFIAATLLEATDSRAASAVHEREVFGPVATLLPYDGTASDAAAIVALGGGTLVASVYSDDSS